MQTALKRPTSLAVALGAAFLLANAAYAQAPPHRTLAEPVAVASDPAKPIAPLPRTPDGRPDFQNVVWTANFFGMLEATPLTPPELVLSEEAARIAFDKMMMIFMSNPGMKTTIEQDPEAAELFSHMAGFPIVRGQRHSRLVVLPADGKLPYTPEARKRASAGGRADTADNPEERSLTERCIATGAQPPMAVISSMHPRQIFQTSDHIVINTEYGDEVRIIPFASARTPNPVPSMMGSAVARWDGDTLVIETTNFSGRNLSRFSFPSGLLLAPDSRVIERYTRVSEDELLYQFTIEDPNIFSAPWLAEYSLYRAPYRMYPSGCHEENYSMPNILRGQRVADVRRARASETQSRPPR